MSRRKPPINKTIEETMVFDPEQDQIFFSYPVAERLHSIPTRQLECKGLFITYFSYLKWQGRVPTISELQKKLGIGKNKILAIRKLLMEYGLIETCKIKDSDGRYFTTKTRLCLEPGYLIRGSPKQVHKLLVLRTTNIIPHPCGDGGVIKKPKKKQPSIGLREDDFERFYSHYPRKVDRKETKKAWSQKIKDKSLPSIGILISVIDQELKGNWKGNEIQFIPHPATWLRKERWANYEDTTPTDDTEDLLEFVISMAEVTKREAHRYLEWLKTQDKKMLFGDKEILPPTGRYWKRWSKKYNK